MNGSERPIHARSSTVIEVDPISALLGDPHARAAFVLRVQFAGRWGLHVRDEAPLCAVAVTSGTAWLTPPADDASGRAGAAPVELPQGSVALIRGPRPYLVGSDPDARPTIVIEPGQVCRTLDGFALEQSMHRGVRTWGSADAAEADTTLVIGVYTATGQLGARLQAALPEWMVQDQHGDPGPATVERLAAEAARDLPGQQAMLDRMVDLLVMSTVRGWLTGVPTRAARAATGWCGGYLDPAVARAIEAMHEAPGKPWTVGELAGLAGMSRALFARRFVELVGATPIAYLTEWRLDVAAERLAAGRATVDTIAREVGYGSGFALSAAFKRSRGVSPLGFRRAQLGAG